MASSGGGGGVFERHQIRRFRRLDLRRPQRFFSYLSTRCSRSAASGDVGRQARRIAAQDFVRRPIAGPHRVELVGSPEIGPGAALRLRDVRSERSVDGRASEAYECPVVHDGPNSRRRSAIRAFRVVGPPPDPLQFRVSLLVVLPNVIQQNSLSRASTSTWSRGSLREGATREAERAVDRRVRRAPNAGNFDRSVALLQGDPKVWLRQSVLRYLSGRGVAHSMGSSGACSYGADRGEDFLRASYLTTGCMQRACAGMKQRARGSNVGLAAKSQITFRCVQRERAQE